MKMDDLGKKQSPKQQWRPATTTTADLQTVENYDFKVTLPLSGLLLMSALILLDIVIDQICYTQDVKEIKHYLKPMM